MYSNKSPEAFGRNIRLFIPSSAGTMGKWVYGIFGETAGTGDCDGSSLRTCWFCMCSYGYNTEIYGLYNHAWVEFDDFNNSRNWRYDTGNAGTDWRIYRAHIH